LCRVLAGMDAFTDDDVDSMKEACGLDDARARFFLSAAGGNVAAAIEAFIDSSSGEPAAPAQPPAPAPMAVERPAPPAAAQPSATTGAARRTYQPSGPRIATFGSLRDDPKPAGTPSHNEAYAGGHSSGMAVMGGPDQPSGPGSLMGAMQRQAVAASEVDKGLPTVTLTAWKDGVFSVDDGVNKVVPKKPDEDPQFKAFLDAVARGMIPPGYARDTHLVFEDKRGEEFKPPPMKSFSGAGRRLGDAVPAVVGDGGGAAAAADAAAAGAAMPAPEPAAPPENQVDESLPTTRVQVRLANGTRLVSRFNPTQTVADLRHFVRMAQPAALGDRSFVLMTTFPNRVIEDETQTLEAAKLCNAAVVQKWK